MATVLDVKKPTVKKRGEAHKPIRFASWAEAQDYFKQHLKPVRYGPKGQPLYSMEEIEALNVELPEEYW